jgi:hypothetical protein
MNRFALIFVLALTNACTPTALSNPGPLPITGTSDDIHVKGQYSSIALDRVEKVPIEHGKIVVHGSSSSVTLDPPAGADTSQPTHTWALTTEAQAGRKRPVTLTHAMSIEEFTIELPESDDEVRYGVFSSAQGVEVMVLAWGSSSRSYWGYVTSQDSQGSEASPGSQGSQGSRGPQ